jgi:hypothetical protein
VLDETGAKTSADSALKSGHLQNSCAGHDRRGLLALSEARSAVSALHTYGRMACPMTSSIIGWAMRGKT